MKFVGVDFAAVPLADVEVSGSIHADVVAVFEDGFVLEEELQLVVPVLGGMPARAGNHAVVFVEDHDEAPFLPHAVVVGFSSEADPGVEVFSVENRSAHIGTGQIDAAHRFALEGEPVELVSDSFGAQEQGAAAAHVDGHAVGLHELAGVDGLSALAAELGEKAALAIKAQDKLRAVAVGDVDVAVGGDGGFRGAVRVVGLIGSDGVGFG